MTLEEKILERARAPSDWHKPKVGVYHASQIYKIAEGYLSPEQFFEQEDFTEETLLKFEWGKMYHSYVQSLFPDECNERKISIQLEDFKIVGSVDLVTDKVIELKTCNRFPARPYQSHIYQVQCYLEALNKQEGVIVYMEKHLDKFPSKEFIIKRDIQLFQDITQKVTKFHEQLKNGFTKQ